MDRAVKQKRSDTADPRIELTDRSGMTRSGGNEMMQRQRAEEFIDCYTRLLTQVWSSEDYSRRLDDDPRAVLSEAGLVTTPDATVEVVRDGTGESDLGHQIDLWSQGFSTGSFILHVPHLPRMDVSELSDADLGDLAGGASTCCCSPCCCQAL
jgi:hypothetical protein